MFVISSNLTTRDPVIGGIFRDWKASGWNMNGEAAEKLTGIIKQIAAAGANAIEINTQQHFDTPEAMKFTVDLIQRNSTLPICVSSNNPEVVEAGLHICKRPPIVNYLSINLDLLRDLFPIVVAHRADIVFLVSEPSTPSDVGYMIGKTGVLLGAAIAAGIPSRNVIFDPGLFHVTSEPGQRHLVDVTSYIRVLQEAFDDEELRTTCWLHNASAGASPAIRNKIETALLPMLFGAGLSTIFMDVLNSEYMKLLHMVKIFKNETVYAQGDVE